MAVVGMLKIESLGQVVLIRLPVCMSIYGKDNSPIIPSTDARPNVQRTHVGNSDDCTNSYHRWSSHALILRGGFAFYEWSRPQKPRGLMDLTLAGFLYRTGIVSHENGFAHDCPGHGVWTSLSQWSGGQSPSHEVGRVHSEYIY